jgi:sugar (pentulose or hexulose) kinase
MSVYLAIDIGTSSAKAALYQQDGRCLVSRSRDYPLLHPNLNWAEQQPAEWWQAVLALSRQVLDESRDRDVRAVCVSGQSPSCVPIDRNGQPLRPAILWLDRRATSQVKWLQDKFSPALAEKVCKNKLDSYFGGLKWLWYLQEEPELYDKTWKILQANAYIVYALTGEISIDPSNAGLCSPCFQLDSGEWNREACDVMGLEPEKLPAIFPSEHIVGVVTREASRATGIPAGVPVVCGAADFACACLGAGVIQPGQAAVMLGTAGNLMVSGLSGTDPRLLNTKHTTGTALSLGGVMAGGVVSWFIDALGIKAPDIHALLEGEASQTPAGAEGLIFLPYLMGERTPIWDPDARGVFFGLSAKHHRGYLYRAVLEGVAYAFRQITEILDLLGRPVGEIIMINGGARSALWRQIFADVLGIPVHWLPNSGGTMLGSAFLAAMGCGDVKSFSTIREWLEPAQSIQPNPDNAMAYHRQYQKYTGLYPRLKDCFTELS